MSASSNKSVSETLAKLPQPVYVSNQDIVKRQVGANVFDLDQRTIFDANSEYKDRLMDNVILKDGPKGELDQTYVDENLHSDYGPAISLNFKKKEKVDIRKNVNIKNILKQGQNLSNISRKTKNNTNLIRTANALHTNANNIFNTVFDKNIPQSSGLEMKSSGGMRSLAGKVLN
jgi:hypothetical protein